MVRPTLIAALTVTLSAAVWVGAAAPGRPDGAAEWEDADLMLEGDPEMAAAARQADARMALARWRAEEKLAAAGALAHGRLTLAEATARFREVNAGDPSAIGLLADDHPSAGEEELAARQVLRFVRVVAVRDPVAARALPALEAEFARRFVPGAGVPAAWGGMGATGIEPVTIRV